MALQVLHNNVYAMNHNITVSDTLIMCMVLAHTGKRLGKANQGKSEMKKNPRQTHK